MAGYGAFYVVVVMDERVEVWKALQDQFCFNFRSVFEFIILKRIVLIVSTRRARERRG